MNSAQPQSTRLLFKITGYAIISLIILYVASYWWLDRPIATWLHHLTLPNTLTRLCHWIGHHLNPRYATFLAIALLIITVLAFITKQLPTVRKPLLTLSINLILSLTIATLLKVMLGRARPTLYFNDHQYGLHWLTSHYNLHSSPSGHAVVFFSIATSLALWIQRRFWTVSLMIIALLLSITRLIILKHFVGDIILGAYVGVLCSLWGYDIVAHAKRLLDRIST